MPARLSGSEFNRHSNPPIPDDDTGVIDQTVDYSNGQLEELLKRDADTNSAETGVPGKTVDPHLKTLDSGELVQIINDLKDDPKAIALERRLQDQKSTIPNPKLVIVGDKTNSRRLVDLNTEDGDPLNTISTDGDEFREKRRERKAVITDIDQILPSLQTRLETQNNYLKTLLLERALPLNDRKRLESDLRSDAALDEQIRFFRDVFIPRTKAEIEAATRNEGSEGTDEKLAA